MQPTEEGKQNKRHTYGSERNTLPRKGAEGPVDPGYEQALQDRQRITRRVAISGADVAIRFCKAHPCRVFSGVRGNVCRGGYTLLYQ